MKWFWYLLAALAAVIILTDSFGFFEKRRKKLAEAAAPYIPPEQRKAGSGEKKAQPAEKSQYEIDRELYRKTVDAWNRCPQRNKSDRSKDLLCNTGNYCVNEFLKGNCTCPEVQKIMSGLTAEKAQDLFPYNEEMFDEDIKNSQWPPKGKYNINRVGG